MISFVLGTIMFFGDKYVISALHFLSLSFAHQDQVMVAASDIVSGAFLVLRAGGIALIVAGAIMFIVGRRQEKVPAPNK